MTGYSASIALSFLGLVWGDWEVESRRSDTVNGGITGRDTVIGASRHKKGSEADGESVESTESDRRCLRDRDEDDVGEAGAEDVREESSDVDEG